MRYERIRLAATTLSLRESSPAITIRHHRSDPFVHLALRQAHTNTHVHTRSLIILSVLLFLLPRCYRRRCCCCCRCRPCLHSILIPICVYGFACSRALLRERAHIATRLGAFGCTTSGFTGEAMGITSLLLESLFLKIFYAQNVSCIF